MLPVYKTNREKHIGRPFEKQRGEPPQASLYKEARGAGSEGKLSWVC